MPDAHLVERLPAEAGSIAPLRAMLVDFAAGAGANDDAKAAVALASSEAITNVVVHAYVGVPRGDIVVEARRDSGGCLLVYVRDSGIGMRPRTDSPGLGVGLTVIAQMADDFRIVDRPDDPGVFISMRFSLDGSGSAS